MSSTSESPLPDPHDNVEPLDYKEQFKGREPSKFVEFVQSDSGCTVSDPLTSPCEGASKASLKCMDLNNYDRSACMDYFQAYRDCKAAWIERRRDDRRAGRVSD
ncbi:hypothetical protein GGX14DRAFT_649992 [Mycena pura]|uniref:CHCH domain-containing protein n=1 Tax=Mycena pura TaxID=153505 RepID=A0AAD7E2S6_9AGAR|nr:hypothetical protein GGX14DRAFT_649992 [Mycena pura]